MKEFPNIKGVKLPKMPTSKERLEMRVEQIEKAVNQVIEDIRSIFTQQSQMNNYFQNNVQIIPQVLKELTAHQKTLRLLFEQEALKDIPFNDIVQKAILETEEEYKKGIESLQKDQKMKLISEGKCPFCYGYGSIKEQENSEPIICTHCKGTGKQEWKVGFDETIKSGYDSIEKFVKKNYSPGNPDDISCVMDTLRKTYFYSVSVWSELAKLAENLDWLKETLNQESK